MKKQIQVGSLLATKDGQASGNAIVIEVNKAKDIERLKKHVEIGLTNPEQVFIIAVTDFGNDMLMPEEYCEENYTVNNMMLELHGVQNNIDNYFMAQKRLLEKNIEKFCSKTCEDL